MKASATRLLVLLVGINFFNYFDRYVLASVLEPVGKELALTDSQLGWLSSAFLIVYMCAAPLFGFIADRANRPKILAVAIFLWSIATTFSAFAHNFESLAFARALVGIGEAAYAGIGPAMLADMYSEKDRATKFTWFYLAIPLGSALGYAGGGALGGTLGWRSGFFISGLPGLVLAVVMFLQKDPPRGQMDSIHLEMTSTRIIDRLKVIFSNRVWTACTVSYIGYTFAMGAMTYWMPTVFQRRYGVATSEAGMIFGGMAVVTGLAGTFLGGQVTKWFQQRYKNIAADFSLVTLMCAVPAVWLGLSAETAQMSYIAFFFALFFLFLNTSPINVLTVSALPAQVRSFGVAINVFLIHLLGDAISPVLVGARSSALGGSGEALASAIMISLPAIVVSSIALIFARTKNPHHAT